MRRGIFMPAYIDPCIWAENRGHTHREYRAHRSTHPQGGGQGEQGQDAPTHHSHSTTQTHHRQGRQGAGHTTGQTHRSSAGRAHSTTQKHSTQKKEQVRTQSDIEVCYSSSVEHKGTDHTVVPNHSTCSPQRGHGTRHQSPRCVLFCVQAGHGIAVGTTQTQNAMRGEEGAAFLPIK